MSTDKKLQVVSIPDFRFSSLEEKVKKINRKANKLGLAPITLSISDEKTTKTFKDPDISPNPITVTFLNVTIEGVIPSIEGWSVVAVIDHIEKDKSIVHVINEEIPFPSEYRTRGSMCDHCGTIRYRKKTIILFNRETSEYMQVGSTCMKDFVARDVRTELAYLESFMSLLSTAEDDEDVYCGTRVDYSFETRSLFADAINIVETFGFVSSKSETGTSSKIDLQDFYFDQKTNAMMLSKFVLSHEAALEKADALIEWIKTNPSESEFFQNLKVLASLEAVSVKYFGYVIGVVPSWRKSIEESRKKEESGAVNEYLDIPLKKRVTLQNVRLVNVMAIDGYYGTTFLHTFNDKDGRSIVWFSTSGSLREDFEKIEERDIIGTIKEFKEYNGTKQTIINRVKLV